MLALQSVRVSSNHVQYHLLGKDPEQDLTSCSTYDLNRLQYLNLICMLFLAIGDRSNANTLKFGCDGSW